MDKDPVADHVNEQLNVFSKDSAVEASDNSVLGIQNRLKIGV